MYRKPVVKPIGLVSLVWIVSCVDLLERGTYLSSNRFLGAGDPGHYPVSTLCFFLHLLIGLEKVMGGID